MQPAFRTFPKTTSEPVVSWRWLFVGLLLLVLNSLTHQVKTSIHQHSPLPDHLGSPTHSLNAKSNQIDDDSQAKTNHSRINKQPTKKKKDLVLWRIPHLMNTDGTPGLIYKEKSDDADAALADYLQRKAKEERRADIQNAVQKHHSREWTLSDDCRLDMHRKITETMKWINSKYNGDFRGHSSSSIFQDFFGAVLRSDMVGLQYGLFKEETNQHPKSDDPNSSSLSSSSFFSTMDSHLSSEWMACQMRYLKIIAMQNEHMGRHLSDFLAMQKGQHKSEVSSTLVCRIELDRSFKGMSRRFVEIVPNNDNEYLKHGMLDLVWIENVPSNLMNVVEYAVKSLIRPVNGIIVISRLLVSRQLSSMMELEQKILKKDDWIKLDNTNVFQSHILFVSNYSDFNGTTVYRVPETDVLCSS